jgi:hypothetical protein
MGKRRRCRGIISPASSDVNGEAGRPVKESRADTSSSSSGDDVVDPVNFEGDVLW